MVCDGKKKKKTLVSFGVVSYFQRKYVRFIKRYGYVPFREGEANGF